MANLIIQDIGHSLGEVCVYNRGQQTYKGGVQMKVNVRIGGRWKDCRKSIKAFELYRRRIEIRLPAAGKIMKFRPPGELTLRPFYYRTPVSYFMGRAMYDFDNGSVIAMSIDECLRERDKGLSVLDHEMAHIATAIKYGEWSHGENFEKVLSVIDKIKR